MRARTAVLSCVLLCGCTSSQDGYEARRQTADEQMVADARSFADGLKAQSEAQIADYDRRLESWKPQLKRYAMCNKQASSTVAVQTGDPLSLAIAARSFCREDEANLRKAITTAYLNNPSFGIEAMENVRKRMLENNAGDIVAYRAKMNSVTGSKRTKEAAPDRGI